MTDDSLLGSPHETPDSIDRYDIGRLLGGGAHGAVYAAEDLKVGAPLAIKVLNQGTPKDEVDNLIQISKKMSCGMVKIHDYGVLPDGRMYFVMPLYERGSLRRRLDKEMPRPASIEEALRLGRMLKDTVGELHQNGFLHGDIKPGNLLLDASRSNESNAAFRLIRDDEQLVLADFATSRRPGDISRLTQLGGTAGYAPPEIVNPSSEMNVTADVYSSTATLVEVMSREHPIQVRHPSDVAFSDEAFKATGPLEAVVRKGLHYDPSDRHQSMMEWWSDLQRAATETEKFDRPLRSRRAAGSTTARSRKSAVAVVAAVVAATLVGGASLAMLRQRGGPAEADSASPTIATPDVSIERPIDVPSTVTGEPLGPLAGNGGSSTVTPAGTDVAVSPSVGQPAPVGSGPESSQLTGAQNAAPPSGTSSPISTAVAGATATRTVSSTTSTPPSSVVVSTASPTNTVSSAVADPGPTSLARVAAANNGQEMGSVVAAVEDLCAQLSSADHGSTVQISGIPHQVVWLASDRSSVSLAGGGYQLGRTGAGPFLIVGSEYADIISGHQANDVICGRGGDDQINGKDGDNVLIGGQGKDEIKAVSGTNVLVGNDSDTLTGGSSTDWCSDLPGTHSTCEKDHRIGLFSR